ncbi:RdRp catalytic domain-containing protein [Durusdinium trenchii]|uniref:RdRp catalytic domain-containing protein n=1 Tax=Durusdinium trenchii TaxID=1381693 RepID=A0ABP0MU40_9DINO
MASSTCDPHFDKHRFDNYTDWLDRETRKKNRAHGRHVGFGFPVPSVPAAPREQRPFVVYEQSMVSGLMVKRQYDQTETSYSTVATRSDPHHYPNYIDVKDADHYKDPRPRGTGGWKLT